ncbi:hypothetical protein [Streptomyces sp. HUAS TT7]|uniref:hypothetical protein n=1 Tax=Streptomyces sp. HUAS TT7 TaxID=3447507 RepID=UPI003F65CAF2
MSPLGGPTGPGTSAAGRFAARPSQPVLGRAAAMPRLDCPPPRRDDPVLAGRLDERLLEWADRIGLYHGRMERVRDAGFGRLATLCHPATDDEDLLMVPARCALAIWALDDHYCDDPDLGAVPSLLGSRLATASAVLGRVHLPDRHEAAFDAATRDDPALNQGPAIRRRPPAARHHSHPGSTGPATPCGPCSPPSRRKQPGVPPGTSHRYGST